MEGISRRNNRTARPASTIATVNYAIERQRLAQAVRANKSIAIEQRVCTDHPEVMQGLYNGHSRSTSLQDNRRRNHRKPVVQMHEFRLKVANRIPHPLSRAGRIEDRRGSNKLAANAMN